MVSPKHNRVTPLCPDTHLIPHKLKYRLTLLILFQLIAWLQAAPLSNLPSNSNFQPSLRQTVLIRQTPEEPVVVEGIPLQLDCILESNSERETSVNNYLVNNYSKLDRQLNYQWLLNGQPILNDPRRYQNGPRLQIAHVLHSVDSGEYKCVVGHSEQIKSVESLPFVLNILWLGERVELLRVRYPQSEQEEDELEERPPERLPTRQINRLAAGDRLALSCETSGYPPPQIDWLLNGEPLLAASGRRSGSTFSVQAQRLYVQPHDPIAVAGTYSCVARNPIGVRSSTGVFNLQYSNVSQSFQPAVPTLRKISDPQRAPVNASLKLHCEFGPTEGTRHPIQWIAPSDDRPLRSDSRRKVLNNGTLIIHSLQPVDEGYFRCVIHSQYMLTFAVRVQVASIGEFGAQAINALYNPPGSRHLILPETNESQILCIAPQGNPTPKVFWLDAHGAVLNNQQGIKIREDRLFIDPSQRFTGNGRFSCVAENPAGIRRASFSVRFINRPNILNLSSVQPLTVNEGDSVTLKCVNESSLNSALSNQYEILWTRNERFIQPDEHLIGSSKSLSLTSSLSPERVQLDSATGRLQLKDVTPDTSGYYSCQLQHDGFPLQTSPPISLQVQPRLRIINPQTNLSVQPSQEATLSCQTSGGPLNVKTKIQWFRGTLGQLLQNTFNSSLSDKLRNLSAVQGEASLNVSKNASFFQHFIELTNAQLTSLSNSKQMWPETRIQSTDGKLKIINVEWSDAGPYTCVAIAGSQWAASSVQLVLVQIPFFTVRPRNLSASAGSDVLLECSASAQPTPKISWEKAGKTVTLASEPRYQQFSNGSLLLHDLRSEDSGIFVCTASNSIGSVRAETAVNVIGVAGRSRLRQSNAARDFIDNVRGSLQDLLPSGWNRLTLAAVGSAGIYIALILTLLLLCRQGGKALERRTRPPRNLPTNGLAVPYLQPANELVQFNPALMHLNEEMMASASDGPCPASPTDYNVESGERFGVACDGLSAAAEHESHEEFDKYVSKDANVFVEDDVCVPNSKSMPIGGQMKQSAPLSVDQTMIGNYISGPHRLASVDHLDSVGQDGSLTLDTRNIAKLQNKSVNSINNWNASNNQLDQMNNSNSMESGHFMIAQHMMNHNNQMTLMSKTQPNNQAMTMIQQMQTSMSQTIRTTQSSLLNDNIASECSPSYTTCEGGQDMEGVTSTVNFRQQDSCRASCSPPSLSNHSNQQQMSSFSSATSTQPLLDLNMSTTSSQHTLDTLAMSEHLQAPSQPPLPPQPAVFAYTGNNFGFIGHLNSYPEFQPHYAPNALLNSYSGELQAEYPRSNLYSWALLGRGEFGEVCLAKASQLLPNQPDPLIMIKTLKNTALSHEFQRENQLLALVGGERVCRLFAVCADHPQLMLLEYSDWGDLKQFLISFRGGHAPIPSLTVLQRLHLLCQVAEAMSEISRLQLYHGDLAARNCMLWSNLSLKLSCNSLSVEPYANEYVLQNGQRLPLRWMPREAFFTGQKSLAADAWSFACVLFEIFTDAQLPYAALEDHQVAELLASNQLRIPYDQFTHLSAQFRSSVQQCFEPIPEQRPPFQLIYEWCKVELSSQPGTLV